jgi:hypothetical protein
LLPSPLEVVDLLDELDEESPFDELPELDSPPEVVDSFVEVDSVEDDFDADLDPDRLSVL